MLKNKGTTIQGTYSESQIDIISGLSLEFFFNGMADNVRAVFILF